MKNFDPVLLCPDCEIIRTDRSRHCSICNQCIERFDHHCPWVNNCVGMNNHGYFMIFLFSMWSLLILTFSSLIYNYTCYENRDIHEIDSVGFFMPFILPPRIYDAWII